MNAKERVATFLLQTLIPRQTAYLAALDGLVESQVDGMHGFAADAASQAHGAVLMIGHSEALPAESERHFQPHPGAKTNTGILVRRAS